MSKGAFLEACRGEHHPDLFDCIHKDSGSCAFHGFVEKTKVNTNLSSAQLDLDKMSGCQSRKVWFDRMSLKMDEMRISISSLRITPTPRETLVGTNLPPHGHCKAQQQ